MTRVIKVGGRPQMDHALPLALAAAYRASPSSLVVVHGGGDEIGMLQRLHGVEARFHGGRRVTSSLDLDIIRMALSGSANKRLVSALNDQGVAAIGVSGEDAGLLCATPIDLDHFGFVGEPVSVNVVLLHHLLAGGLLPVISPVSRHESAANGEPATLNVNGDDAAAAIATAVQAEELLLVSDVAGVLVDGMPVEELDAETARQLIADGTASGGMGAKLQAALSALAGGVKRVRISDIAAIESFDRGTVLTREESVCA